MANYTITGSYSGYLDGTYVDSGSQTNGKEYYYCSANGYYLYWVNYFADYWCVSNYNGNPYADYNSDTYSGDDPSAPSWSGITVAPASPNPTVTKAWIAPDGVTWNITTHCVGATTPLTGTFTDLIPKINGTDATFTSATLSGNIITATCDTSASSSDTVALHYTPGDIADSSSHAMDAFTSIPTITNYNTGKPVFFSYVNTNTGSAPCINGGVYGVNSSANIAVTTNIPVGTRIIVSAVNTNGLTSITDSQSNTYVRDNKQGTSSQIEVWSGAVTTELNSGDTITLHNGSNDSYLLAQASAWFGIKESGYQGNWGISNDANTVSTRATANSLVLSIAGGWGPYKYTTNVGTSTSLLWGFSDPTGNNDTINNLMLGTNFPTTDGAVTSTLYATGGSGAHSLLSQEYLYGVGSGGTDTTSPVIDYVDIDATGTGLTIYWTETGSSPILPSTAGTGLSIDGVSYGAVTLSNVNTIGTKTTATISRPILYEETVTLSGTSVNFTDTATNAVVDFSAQAITNNSGLHYDVTPPVVYSATINSAGTTLTIVWTEAGDPTGNPPVLPATSGSGLSLSGMTYGAATLSSINTSGTTTTATISRAIYVGEILTLHGVSTNFTDSAYPPNDVVDFTHSITNSSTQPAYATGVDLLCAVIYDDSASDGDVDTAIDYLLYKYRINNLGYYYGSGTRLESYETRTPADDITQWNANRDSELSRGSGGGGGPTMPSQGQIFPRGIA